MKAVVAAFNQEKALVGAFSVITNFRICFGWNFLKHYCRPTQGAAAAANARDGAEAEPPNLLLDEGEGGDTGPHPHQQRVPDIFNFA